MKEKHFAYKITLACAGLVCTHSEIEEDKMIDLLKDIQQTPSDGIFWIFKEMDNHPKEPLCIIDKKRIYYHYSGEVENIDEAIKKLTRTKPLKD